MDSRLPELTRRFDGAKLLGYLNFSDGRPDPKFRQALADVFAFLLAAGDPAPWGTVLAWLAARAGELEASGPAAFRDLAQAKAVLPDAVRNVPVAYRRHHADLLAHQPDGFLFNAFFLARCCEAVLSQRGAGTPIEAAVGQLNDYVGYRPIAALETRPQTDYYPHEKVCPVPLYVRGVGVAPGPYADVILLAVELLERTDHAHLQAASFDPKRMLELCVDPRAVDHFHPVNKRPSVLFGEWDPHRIDGEGYFTRYVVRQPTLDALIKWAARDGAPSERLFEAAAALCGTVLMGAGVSGAGPTHHDSTVTLSTLVQRIARYRDEFYRTLLAVVPGPHGDRLRGEAARLKQPFAGVRQYLNQTIAAERALHLQERRLALLFAAMGYPATSRARAARIAAPATRFATEIRLRQTEAGFAVRAGKLAVAARLLGEAEDLVRRAIECGALIDPWNVLGYQGLFPIFPGREDTVRDPRTDDLILTVGRQFDLYADAVSAAAASDEPAIGGQLGRGMRDLAAWWDKFATPTVADLPRVHGGERAEAGEHVARAMALWRTGGAADPAFWRGHREGFRTPAAFAQVIEALLAHGDYRAALALLVTWLGDAHAVPLQDPAASFFRLAFQWVRGVVTGGATPTADRRPLLRRFFELIEANAEERWRVPDLGLTTPTSRGRGRDKDEGGEDADDDSDDPFASAYEGVTYRDSTDDGEEGSVADGGGPVHGEFPLDGDSDPAEDRLRFLSVIARLWRMAARTDLWAGADPAALGSLREWLRTARGNLTALRDLTERLYAVEIPEPGRGVEGAMEYDRRRAVKGHLLELAVQTCVETGAAARALAAVLPPAAELPPGALRDSGPPADTAAWEAEAIRLERAIGSGNAAATRKALKSFVTLFGREPLLVHPPAEGGPPAPAIRAQTALHTMESLLARLPRLGLLRETFHLTKLARAMERNAPPESRRVSSFNQLFRTAVVGVCESLLTSAREWAEDTSEESELADALRKVADSFQAVWVDHSVGLRLSALEAVLDRDEWDDLREFVRKYGGDLFTVRFLTLSNVRGILGQGAAAWFDREAARENGEETPKVVAAWADGAIDRPQTARLFEVILRALVEHYDEYRDYNTTTTQSDYGENLYILLDFLRVKAKYDRFAWRLMPMVLAHEALCRAGFDRMAAKWREHIAGRTGKLAKDLLDELTAKEAEHAMTLRTIRDRLEERFVHSLRIDQAAARVARAAAAAADGQGEDNPAFTGLLATILPLADHPSGVGLDVPTWLRRLEEELQTARAANPDGDGDANEIAPPPATVPLPLDEVRRQLEAWEAPLGE